MVVALLLIMAGATGCGLRSGGPGPATEGPGSFTVLLTDEVTDGEHQAIEAALTALPGVTGVDFTSRDAAAERMRGSSSAAPDSDSPFITETFRVRMTDLAAVRLVRDTDTTLKTMPGVRDIVYPCTTVPECRNRTS